MKNSAVSLEKKLQTCRGQGLTSYLSYLTGFILMVFLLLSCGIPPRQKALEILQAGIADESAIIRVNAAKGLEQIGDELGMRVLLEILEGDNRDGVVASMGALSDLRVETLLPAVVKLTKSKDPLIRTEAYSLIAAMENEKCRDIFVSGIADSIAKIRRISFLGLGKFKEKALLIIGLRDIDPLVRIAAAKAMGNFGEEGMASFIIKEMETTKIEILKHGIIALAEMGDTAAIFLSKGFITGTPWELRLTAAEALLILNDQKSISIVKEGLMSNDPFTRIKAVDILKRHHVSDAFELLKEAVRDEYVNVSVGAMEALVTFHAKECKKLFEEMMDAPNPMVRIVAATAYLRSSPLPE